MENFNLASVSPAVSAPPSRRSPNGLSVLVDPDEKVTINVGGQKFVTNSSTLKNVSGTLLSKLDPTDRRYDVVAGEYFFDRNPRYFASILDYYRTGILHFPHCFCGPSIKAELDFWGLDENCISDCCWRAYRQFYEEKDTLDELDKTLSGIHPKPNSSPPEQQSFLWRWKSILWRFLDKPNSSKGAQIWAIVFFLLILLSIAVVVMETHPAFRVKRKGFELSDVLKANETINPKLVLYYETTPHMALLVVDGLCVMVFTLELVMRFLSCPSKLRFIKSFFNIVDIICVLPLFVVFIVNITKDDFLLREHSIILIGYLSLTSVLRVFRLFKIARYYRSFRLLILAVKSSTRELFLLILLISMGMLIFSTLIYFAEFQIDNKFKSIPIGFWWSIITMTTVGYGEITPSSGWGFLVGGICAVSGMLITGLPIPIIASNFNHYHLNARFASSLASKKAPTTVWKEPRNQSPTPKPSPCVIRRSPGPLVVNYNDEMYRINVPIIERDPSSPTHVRRARSAFTPLCASPGPTVVHVRENGEILNSYLDCPRIVADAPDTECTPNTLQIPRNLFPRS